MNVKEVKELFPEAVDVEIFYPQHGCRNNLNALCFHPDFVNFIDDDATIANRKVIKWELMDEEDYQRTILCNSCVDADFAGWYGDKSAKVLCILIEKPERN